MSFFEFPHTRTYDTDLGWLIKSVKKLIECCEQMQDWKAEHELQYEELKKLYDDIISGNFPPSVIEAFNKWMRENAFDLVGELVKLVFFGITDDGYFVAYIPESWEDIIFNTTGYDIFPPDIDFGHLTLSFEIGGI